MKISKSETQKRIRFLKDFFSSYTDASCRRAQQALRAAFGQEMRPLVVSAVKKEVIEAQNEAIISQGFVIPSGKYRELVLTGVNPMLGLTPGDNTVILAPTGCECDSRGDE